MDNKIVKTNDDNLETFSLLWLDEQINTTEDNRQTQQKIREIINHLKIFDNSHQCQQYILSLSSYDRIVLIISGRCGKQLVPQIHQLRQLSSIYVYCMDKQAHEQWTNKFPKIKCVTVQLDVLINQIKADQRRRVKIEEPMSINIFTNSKNSDQSTTLLNGHFIHSLLLIDVLLRMKSIETDKQQLITLCKTVYQNNNTQLDIVDEFEHKYTAHKALWWYTRECFLYKMLNKALRIQNIDLLFLFRFVISDICRQLKENQCQSSIRVYRGQLMSNDELILLQGSIGNLLSLNSFFSTSSNRDEAMAFLDCSTGLHRVLFEIDADSNVVTTVPFGNVSKFSEYADESEILFMIGGVFRLNEIHQDDKKNIWMIRMKLCGDNEYDLKQLFDYMKKEYGSGDDEVSLHSFANVVYKMGKYDLAEKMYYRLLNEHSFNDSSLSELYRSFGEVTRDKGDYDASLQWFHKSLEIKIQICPSDYVNIGNLYNLIGMVHRKNGDRNKALDFYNKAIDLFKQAQDENHPDMGYLYNNIAIIYNEQKKYTEALEMYEKSLIIRKKYLPSDHPDLAVFHSNIGVVHYNLRQHDHAMEHYQRSLEIRLKSLPSQHPKIAMSYSNIGSVYEAKNDWEQALKFFQQAAVIYKQSLPSQHPDVIQIEADIRHVSSKLEQNVKFLMNLFHQK